MKLVFSRKWERQKFANQYLIYTGSRLHVSTLVAAGDMEECAVIL